MRQDVLLNWKFGCTFGWGVLGMNIFCQWANDKEIRPLMSHRIENPEWQLSDPLRYLVVKDAIQQSDAFVDRLDELRVGGDIVTETIVVEPVGPYDPSSRFFGIKHIGRCIFEDSNFGLQTDFSKYDALLVASEWNADILRARTDLPVKVIFEGVDTSIFCPGPKSGALDCDKFYIFSGGKLEHRKGQDLVLLAFREFSHRHQDVVLVTNWHSPWPHISAGFKGLLDEPVKLGQQGWLNIMQWVADNGIDPKRVIDIGMVPNHTMPCILREMDVCLQPSRAEACTNLPVKEAMACGVPVIAGYNSGMRDILTPENSLMLTKQGPVHLPGTGTEGWGESDVEEILSHLEWAYENRGASRDLGLAASRWIEHEGRTWRTHARSLKDFVLSIG